ncbi:MAG: (2Fe-2S)-binding protein [Candidatus Rokuibacteriota bacterium]|nr:MAG: (2Fe-2S)-binding protein [Candidatus Rokubacteria bacterium]
METRVRLDVNGQAVDRVVDVRRLLSDFLREDVGLTGTHVGCEHGVCGACTVLVDGESARSCLLLAVQLDGAAVTTIEGLTPAAGLSPLQEAFRACHGLQCGFCTPGMIVVAHELLARNAAPTTEEIREALAANLCMCTGYVNIVRAVARAAGR